MRKFAMRAAVGATALVIAGALAAPAQANEWADIEKDICAELDASPTQATLVDITNDAIEAEIPGSTYQGALMEAVNKYCPKHYSLVSSFTSVLFSDPGW
jgi:hypothetical protein